MVKILWLGKCLRWGPDLNLPDSLSIALYHSVAVQIANSELQRKKPRPMNESPDMQNLAWPKRDKRDECPFMMRGLGDWFSVWNIVDKIPVVDQRLLDQMTSKSPSKSTNVQLDSHNRCTDREIEVQNH